MAGKKLTGTEITGDGRETIEETLDDGDPNTSDPVEIIEIDTTTPEGSIILQLTEQVDDLRMAMDEQALLKFVFRSAMGKDQEVKLPARKLGETDLVIKGSPKQDNLGRWDIAGSDPFEFVWEDPANRPVPMNRCAVTGEGCPHVNKDLGYCELCPGLSDELRTELGFAAREAGV